MNILQDLNSRKTEKGIYANNYMIKDSINSVSGVFFMSESRLDKFVIDYIAFQKNNEIDSDYIIMDNALCFLDKKKNMYRNKIKKIDKTQYKVYLYSFVLSTTTLSAYYIHSNIFRKWIYIDQIGVGYNLLFWYRHLGRRDISIFGKWKKDFIWEQTQLNFTGASRAMTIVMNIYQN